MLGRQWRPTFTQNHTNEWKMVSMTGTTKRGPQCRESLQCWIRPSQWDQGQLLWVSGTRAKLCRIHRSLKSEERLKEHSYRRVNTTRTCYYCLYLLCSDFLRAPEITQPLQSCTSPSFFPFSEGREIGSYYVFCCFGERIIIFRNRCILMNWFIFSKDFFI